MKEKKPIKSVPQIYVDEKYIGGHDNFMNTFKITYDYDKLHKITKVVSNLDKIIDCNFYPTEKARRSNIMHRPIGIGVQGLTDTFALMKILSIARQLASLIKIFLKRFIMHLLKNQMKLPVAA